MLLPWAVVVAQCSGRVHTSWERGRGFESRWVLGFFLFSFFLCFSLSLYQCCVLNQVPHGGATSLTFPKKVCLAVQLEAKQV